MDILSFMKQKQQELANANPPKGGNNNGGTFTKTEYADVIDLTSGAKNAGANGVTFMFLPVMDKNQAVFRNIYGYRELWYKDPSKDKKDKYVTIDAKNWDGYAGSEKPSEEAIAKLAGVNKKLDRLNQIQGAYSPKLKATQLGAKYGFSLKKRKVVSIMWGLPVFNGAYCPTPVIYKHNDVAFCDKVTKFIDDIAADHPEDVQKYFVTENGLFNKAVTVKTVLAQGYETEIGKFNVSAPTEVSQEAMDKATDLNEQVYNLKFINEKKLDELDNVVTKILAAYDAEMQASTGTMAAPTTPDTGAMTGTSFADMPDIDMNI